MLGDDMQTNVLRFEETEKHDRNAAYVGMRQIW